MYPNLIANTEQFLVLYCVLEFVFKVDGSETTLLDSLLNTAKFRVKELQELLTIIQYYNIH